MTGLSRRQMLQGAAAAAGLGLAAPLLAAASGRFPIAFSDAEWRRRLDRDAYAVLRRAATERPHSSPLDRERRSGTFACKGCGNALFRSSTKFDSGTGWPSFYAAVQGAVGTSRDGSGLGARTEVHCARCGGHLGHVFRDGPRPTGLRYCINGAALRFRPA